MSMLRVNSDQGHCKCVFEHGAARDVGDDENPTWRDTVVWA
jgi:hypothetical protein